MHHVFISILLIFVTIMVTSSLIKFIQQDQDKMKSDKTKTELTSELKAEAQSYLAENKLDVDLASVVAADVFFFKNRREIAVVLSTADKDYLLNTTFKNLSPGYGIREKLYELTPPEGVYKIEFPGFQSNTGYFVKLSYPPAEYESYQRLSYEDLKKDPILVSEKVRSSSFIQADSNFMKLLVYLSASLDEQKVRLLIYPDRPPLTMEIGGTEFIANIYLNLEDEYKKLNELLEALKPKL